MGTGGGRVLLGAACALVVLCGLDTGEARGQEFVTLAPGTFTMGSPTSELGHSGTQETLHVVTLTRPFELATHETTEAELKAILTGFAPTGFPSCGDDCPAQNVTWFDALAFANQLSLAKGLAPCYNLTNVYCWDSVSVGTAYMTCYAPLLGHGGIKQARWTLAGVSSNSACTGYRLPTDAEWEYAMRAGSTTAIYPSTGNDGSMKSIDTDPNVSAIARYKTTGPWGVEQKAPNAWDLFDLAGNVAEWVWDGWQQELTGPVTDPEIDPAVTTYHAYRNCSWQDPATFCRSAFRRYVDNRYRDSRLGFRVARTREFGVAIDAPTRSGTVAVGDTLRFAGRVVLAPSDRPTTVAWDLGDGRSSVDLAPGLVTYHTEGTRVVALSLRDAVNAVVGTSDTRTLVVVADPGNLPDLVAAALDAPADLEIGVTRTLAYTVTNAGKGPASGSWTDAIYLSDDPYLDAGDTRLAGRTSTGPVPAGGSYGGSLTVKIPAVAEGLHYLILVADEAWALFEQHRLNDELARPTTVALTGLDDGTPWTGDFSTGADRQDFGLDLQDGQSAKITVSSPGNEAACCVVVYARLGQPPTDSLYDERSTFDCSATQEILIAAAKPGTWYVRVDGCDGSGGYTVAASVFAVGVTGVSPTSAGSSVPVDLAVNGAGFRQGASVALVSASGAAIPASEAFVVSYERIDATIPLQGVPAGTYGVRVTNPDGVTATLAGAFTVVAGGSPSFRTHLVLPATLGFHVPATLLLEYSNDGLVAMPAPLVRVRGDHHVQLTLDPALVAIGLWASSTPDGFDDSVTFLASGATPGVLKPGEAGRVAIYYAGLARPWPSGYPRITFTTSVTDATDPTPLGWDFGALRPPDLTAEAWAPVSRNLAAVVGSTWGDFVTRLSHDARYLGRLGVKAEGLADLWQLELTRAMGLGPLKRLAAAMDARVEAPGFPIALARWFPARLHRRFDLGPFGRGWVHGWMATASADAEGSVSIRFHGGFPRRYQPDSRSNGFLAAPWDRNVLVRGEGGSLQLQAPGGLTYEFGSGGRLDSVADLAGNRVTAAYSGGLLTGLTHSSGAHVGFAYNAAGRVSSVTDDTGRTTTYDYDAANEHLLEVHAPSGAVTKYRYGGASGHLLVEADLPGGRRIGFTEDAEGQVARVDLGVGLISWDVGPGDVGEAVVTDGAGAASRLAYDARGTLLRFQNPLLEVRRVSSDDPGLVLRLARNDGAASVTAFNRRFQPIGWTDEAGNRLATAYAAGSRTHRPRWFEDGRARRTSWTYDAAENVVAATMPDFSRLLYERDAHGSLVSATNRRGATVAYTRDAAGRVTRKTFADGTRHDFAWDAGGHLLSYSDGTGTTSVGWDGDRPVSITSPDGRTLAFTYDDADRRKSLADPSGNVVHYAYDAAGRLSTVTGTSGTLLASWQYNAAGLVARRTLGNGVRSEYDYDAAGQVRSVDNLGPDGSRLSRYLYTYDELGRRASMQGPDGTWTYGYDLTGQLTAATFASTNPVVASRSLAWTYDAAGNRVSSFDGGTSTTWIPDTMNRYLSAGNTTFAYDADGNLSKRTEDGATTQFGWTDEGRLASVTTAAGTTTFTYDAIGNRVAATANGVTTRFLVDPSGRGDVVAEYDGSGAQIARYVHAGGLIARVAAGGAAYYTFDATGATSEVTDPSGAVLDSYAYQPFGEVMRFAESFPNRYRFGGEAGVEAAGDNLYFMRARFYDAGLGRFLSEDPFRLGAGDANLYRYAGNDPVDFADPDGLEKCSQSGSHWDKLNSAAKMAWRASGVPRKYAAIQGVPGVGWANAAGTVWNVSLGSSMLSADYIFEGLTRGPGGVYNGPGGPGGGDGGGGDDNGGDGGGDDGGGGDGGGPGGCSPNPPAPGGGDDQTDSSGSSDPNAKTGPAGYGSARWLGSRGLMSYRIEFENDPAALAPAQQVDLRDPLDPHLDPGTFELTELGFGDEFIAIPPHTARFETTIALERDGVAFDVVVSAGLDRTTRQVYAHFLTLSPDTGLPPSDVSAGFLPPEDGTGRGRGHFGYVVRPLASTITGDEVRNVATLIFDNGTPITTDQVDPHDPAKGTDPTRRCLNTFDFTAPVSTVSALPPTRPGRFTVSWAGTDAHSGIRSYDVYVQRPGGSFERWMAATTATNATFDATAGGAYAFYCVATDHVGNAEVAPAAGQATTTVSATTDSDADGMPDCWEVGHGLDPFLDDSSGDPDVDGRTNLDEYRFGTDPHFFDDLCLDLHCPGCQACWLGACMAVVDGAACSDGSACTIGDACTAGTCQPGKAVTCPAPGPCRAPGTCDPATGACSDPAAPDGTACDDASACTVGDACVTGACRPGKAVTCPAPGPCRAPGTCDPATGACSDPAAPDGTPCDDGSACTVGDNCLTGTCQPGLAANCTASDTCHVVGTCDPTTGDCSDPAAPDGTACNDGDPRTGADACLAGACSGIPCTCGAGAPPACCRECFAVNEGGACDDGDRCTGGDTCAVGVCAGVATACPVPDPCHLPGICDPVTGSCTWPAGNDGADCSGGDPALAGHTCANGMCVAAGCTCSGLGACCDGCQETGEGGFCNDGDACSLADTCHTGICVGSDPVVCPSPDACHAQGTCDPATGTCSQPPLPAGTPCDDGDPCTGDDRCDDEGDCTGTPWRDCLPEPADGLTPEAQDDLSGTDAVIEEVLADVETVPDVPGEDPPAEPAPEPVPEPVPDLAADPGVDGGAPEAQGEPPVTEPAPEPVSEPVPDLAADPVGDGTAVDALVEIPGPGDAPDLVPEPLPDAGDGTVAADQTATDLAPALSPRTGSSGCGSGPSEPAPGLPGLLILVLFGAVGAWWCRGSRPGARGRLP